MNVTTPPDADVTRMEEAADWIVRLHDAPGDDELVAAWLQWCEADAENLQTFRSMQATWHAAIPAVAAARPHARSGRRSPVLRRFSARLAAGIALFVLATGALLGVLIERETHVTRQSYATPIAGAGKTVLPDGSLVDLGAGSRLTTEYSAGARNIRIDEGEAYFQVAKDATRPFIVTAGSVRVRAVGTQFNVRMGADRVVVAVSEGKVQVASAPAHSSSASTRTTPLPLSAGEQALYDRRSEHIAVARISAADTASWRQGVLKYEQEPLDSVVADLSRYYARPIHIRDPKLRDLPFTGTVFSNDIEHALHAFEDVFPLRVVESDDSVELVPRD